MAMISDVIIIGSWGADAISAAKGSVIDGLIVDAGSPATSITYHHLCNARSESPSLFTLTAIADNAILENVWGFDALVDGGGFDFLVLDNVDTGTKTPSGSINWTGDGARFSNCRINDDWTMAGDRNVFTGCHLGGDFTVSSGANDNAWIGSQIGIDAGGGSTTITVQSGSNRSRIVGCALDAAISDSGTDTVTIGNTLY